MLVWKSELVTCIPVCNPFIRRFPCPIFSTALPSSLCISQPTPPTGFVTPCDFFWEMYGTPADFTHIFWDCPQSQDYWQEVTQFIHGLTTILLTISVCLLGLVEQLALAKAACTLIRILFYARKAMVLKWKSPNPPTLSSWRQLVDKARQYRKY